MSEPTVIVADPAQWSATNRVYVLIRDELALAAAEPGRHHALFLMAQPSDGGLPQVIPLTAERATAPATPPALAEVLQTASAALLRAAAAVVDVDADAIEGRPWPVRRINPTVAGEITVARVHQQLEGGARISLHSSEQIVADLPPQVLTALAAATRTLRSGRPVSIESVNGPFSLAQFTALTGRSADEVAEKVRLGQIVPGGDRAGQATFAVRHLGVWHTPSVTAPTVAPGRRRPAATGPATL